MLKLSNKNKSEIAGLILFIAGMILIMGIIAGEIYYPEEYSTRDNEISDLGATPPPNSVTYQPSATIFTATMVFTGIMVLIASLLLYKEYKNIIISTPIAMLGIGLLGISIFPASITPWHSAFALITFVAGGFSALTSIKIVRSPLSYVFIIIALISLILLFLNPFFDPHLGEGGTERFVIYPLIFWMMGFGTYLIGINKANELI